MDYCWVLIKLSLCFSCGPYSILSPYHTESLPWRNCLQTHYPCAVGPLKANMWTHELVMIAVKSKCKWQFPAKHLDMCSYNNPSFATDDFAKEPPALPPHLQLTLLNVPPAMDATATLPRPQHVILNHLYNQRATHGVNAVVVGTTHRYKSKYVTSVLYKPKRRRTVPVIS